MIPDKPPGHPLKIAGLLVASAGVVALVSSGALDDIDGDRVLAWIEGAGVFGPLVFVLLLALLQPLHVSIYVFLFTAVALWGPWEALLYGWVGIQCASLWSFVVSRTLARDFFERRIPERVRPYLDRMETAGFKTVLITRVLFYTVPAVQWSYGVTPVKMRDFVAGTALGTIHTTVIAVFLGDVIVGWWGDLASADRLWVGGLALSTALAAMMGLWLWRRHHPFLPDGPDP